MSLVSSAAPVWCVRHVVVIAACANALTMGLAAAPLRAQGSTRDSVRSSAPVPAKRPDFRNLRFDETWTRLPNAHTWDEQIKAIPLSHGKDFPLDLTFGGQLRWREESAHAFMLAPDNDLYGQSRIQLTSELRGGRSASTHARLFAEFRDAQSYDRDLPGGTRTSDADRSDMQNLFGEVGYRRSFVRVGRQEVAIGRERLVGVPDWSNTRRAMQGTRLMLVRGALAVESFDLRPVQVRVRLSDLADSTTRFRGISFGSAPGATVRTPVLPATWQLYHYDQRIEGTTPTQRRTTGLRSVWSYSGTAPTSTRYGFETEAALQRGTNGTRDIRAWFITTEVQLQWRGVHGAPSLSAGIEEASGDHDPRDARAEAFNALYAAAHAHGGYADVFGRTNARQSFFIGTWDATRRLALRVAAYRYDRLLLSDGIYTKQNTLLRAASGSRARHAGDEVDLTGTYTVTRHLKVIAGHAWVAPGAFLRETPGGALHERWGFVGTTFTF
jgi:hypothetical protein